MPTGKIENHITIVIADDEAPARKRIKSLLSEYKEFTIIGEAENGDQLLTEIITKEPQVAFLDINMPGASVFKTIPSLKNPPLIVFQTAYSEYGAKAFDINAVDYLLKPVSRGRFSQALEKIALQLNAGGIPSSAKIPEKEPVKDVISIKTGESLRVLKIDKISRLSFEDGFSFVHYGKEKLYSEKSLNTYEEMLKERGFYRISRNDMINLLHISKLHPMFNGRYIVELTSGEKISISRRRVQGLKELLS